MIRFSSRRARGGYAMGLFLVVLSVLTSTVVMLLGTAASESRNSYRQEQLTAAKLTGLSAIDSFYARLQTVPDFPEATSPAGSRADVNPTGSPAPWFKIKDGVVTACVDEVDPCYQLQTDLAQGSRKQIMEVVAKVRYYCRGGGCSYAYFNQRLRAWQFTDFLFYTQYNVISPEFYNYYPNYFPTSDRSAPDRCAKPYSERVLAGLTDTECPMIAYTGADTVEGPVYTADNFVLVCPNGGKNVADIFPAPGASSKVWSLPVGSDAPVRSASEATLRGDPGCNSLNQSWGKAATFPLRMPPTRTTFKQAESVSRFDLPANAVLTFSGRDITSVSSNGSERLVLADGDVVTVDGNATITGGTFEGRASLFVKGKLTVKDSLTYTGPLRDGSGNPTGSVLGINTGGDIMLEARRLPRNATTGSCPNSASDEFKLDAILVSLGGTVYADNMGRTLTSTECPQLLRLRGAVATKYQGVYGLYDGSTGSALAGFTKSFEHDTRSIVDLDYLPPYLVTPSGLQWIRLQLGEIYCDSTTCP
jgi:hypothetical protein